MSLPDRKDAATDSRKSLLDLVWSAIGAAVAIGLALWFVADGSSLFLLASLGGSTVFLFALTDAEAAQPRALFGGHLAGAAIGIFCFQFFGDPLWVSVLSVVLTLVFMMVTRTTHPPAGANPLFMVHYHASFQALLKPVGLGVLILFLVAVVWSRMRPGRLYPIKWWRK
jgi:CBS-domain-containing membrane protein